MSEASDYAALYENVFLPRTAAKASGCIEWTGERNAAGYGRFWSRGKRFFAHRFAWSFWNGSIPAGLFVCHRCDNPKCVNHEHLFVGTQTDNRRDCVAKGRAKNGYTGATHCPRGHSLGDAYLGMTSDGRLRRTCRPCQTARYAAYRQRRREAQRVA